MTFIKLTRRAKHSAYGGDRRLREELKQGNRSIFSARLKRLLKTVWKKGRPCYLSTDGAIQLFNVLPILWGSGKCPHNQCVVTSHKRQPDDDTITADILSASRKHTLPPWLHMLPLTFWEPENRRDITRMFQSGSRMDLDTTSKGQSSADLICFAKESRIILIGTQMIVKDHDFPKVTGRCSGSRSFPPMPVITAAVRGL